MCTLSFLLTVVDFVVDSNEIRLSPIPSSTSTARKELFVVAIVGLDVEDGRAIGTGAHHSVQGGVVRIQVVQAPGAEIKFEKFT